MKTIVVLILAFIFLDGAAGQHCPGVRFLPVKAACQEAAGTRLMYDMCMDTLHPDPNSPSTAVEVEVTAYALIAAQRALDSYLATADAIIGLLSGSLDGDQRATYDACLEDYGYAENSMHHVAGDLLPGCSFGGLVDEYMNGVVHLESCRTRLMNLGGSPVYAMNLVDRNKQLLAYSIAKLLGI